jgi:hypothetical protein
MTGWRFTSSMPAMMRSLSSCFEVTRMWRRRFLISAARLSRLLPKFISAANDIHFSGSLSRRADHAGPDAAAGEQRNESDIDLEKWQKSHTH